MKPGMGNLPETARLSVWRTNENAAGTGADPGNFAGEISMDTGLADASDSALTGDNPMAEAGALSANPGPRFRRHRQALLACDRKYRSWLQHGHHDLLPDSGPVQKSTPPNVIQSEVSTPVSAPADARVVSVGTNEEIGNYVDLDLGNGYTAVCGQLKEIPVVENEYVRQGDLLGYVAEPTKYYAVEGTNVFFEFLKDGVPVDALDFLE